MKMFTLLFLFTLSTTIFGAESADNCISTNCDLYRVEKALFEAKLASINCVGTSDSRKECDQDKLAIYIKEYSAKISAIFDAPNVKAILKNDIHFNSLTNSFAEKTQNAKGYYELIPPLSSPNIGVHSGAIANYQAYVEKIVNLDPNAPDVKKSNWYLTQWKKTVPLMLGETRKDPVITNSAIVDGNLGKPIFEINSPPGKYGVETSLYIFRDKKADANVFEIVGRNGWLNTVGGSNVFLSSNVLDLEHNTFDQGIYLTMNMKVSKMKVRYDDNSADTKGRTVVGQAFAAFTAAHRSPTTGKYTNLFVQIFLADTRKENFVFSGCYMHGENLEIVYTHNLDEDFSPSAHDSTAALSPRKYDMNKYLCHALTQKFRCPADKPTPDFAGLTSDLKNWRIGSFYTGVETQSSSAPPENEQVAGPIKGDVELGMQYSNIRLTANSNEKYNTCADVFNKPEPDPSSMNPTCSKGNFKDERGRVIEFTCGCGDLPGGNKQANGCFHRVATDQSQTPTPTPATPAPAKSCSTGSFTNGKNQIINYSCNCGEVEGGAKQADGCYHKFSGRTAEPKQSTIAEPTPTTIEGATHGSFCVGVKKTNWICNAGTQDSNDGWVDAGGGCFHKATDKDCD